MLTIADVNLFRKSCRYFKRWLQRKVTWNPEKIECFISAICNIRNLQKSTEHDVSFTIPTFEKKNTEAQEVIRLFITMASQKDLSRKLFLYQIWQRQKLKSLKTYEHGHLEAAHFLGFLASTKLDRILIVINGNCVSKILEFKMEVCELKLRTASL